MKTVTCMTTTFAFSDMRDTMSVAGCQGVYPLQTAPNCLIFYNTIDRPGAEIEAETIEEAMILLKCYTKVNKNPTKNSIIYSIDNSAVPNPSALICIIMSHGKDGTLFMDGESLSVQDILTAMDAPDLQGKPKVLIIQACRGSIENTSVHDRSSSAGSFELSSPDMLAVYSSLKGGRAARNVMIPLLAKTLKNARQDEDLCELVHRTMTEMTKAVPQQVPEMRSTLRYRVVLKKVS